MNSKTFRSRLVHSSRRSSRSKLPLLCEQQISKFTKFSSLKCNFHTKRQPANYLEVFFSFVLFFEREKGKSRQKFFTFPAAIHTKFNFMSCDLVFYLHFYVHSVELEGGGIIGMLLSS